MHVKILKLSGQIADMQNQPRRESAGTLDRIFELAHVPRPRVVRHGTQGIIAQNPRRAAVAFQAIKEMSGEQRNVFAAIAKRRNAQADHVQPVVEVLAKAALFDHSRQIAIGGGEDTNLDGNAVRSTHRPNLFFLQGAQQLGLQIEGQLADLVEKHGPAIGRGQ